MRDSIAMAARNNALHSEAVLTAQGSVGEFNVYFWVNSHTHELPYAHGITLGGPTYATEQMNAVESLSSLRSKEHATVIADSWSNLDLEPLGFRILFRDLWLVHQASPMSTAPLPEGLIIEPVSSPEALAEFEAADLNAFHDHDVEIPVNPGWHYAVDLLAEPRTTFLAGRVEGVLASGVILFNDGQCVGLYSLLTLPGYRRRGYGEALARTATSVDLSLPAIANPTDMSQGIFERLGYHAVGMRTLWICEPEEVSSGEV